MALIRRTGAGVILAGRHWTEVSSRRAPPIPRGDTRANHCPVCRQPRYGDGTWRASGGPPRWNAAWHEFCLWAWTLWTSPERYSANIAMRQGFVCPETGASLIEVEETRTVDRYGLWRETREQHLVPIEVDHIVPLWRVRAEASQHEWPDVLRFWGPGNLQALTRDGHRAKTAREAQERARMRASR